MFNSLKDFQSSAMLLEQTFDAGVLIEISVRAQKYKRETACTVYPSAYHGDFEILNIY